MNLLIFKRHCSSFSTSKLPPTKESQILHLCKSGLLYDATKLLNSSQVTAKPILYASLLQTCTKLLRFNHGLEIHAHVIKSGLEADRFVGNSLLALYFKLGSNFRETRKVFDGLFVKDVISWTSMISGYVKVGKPNDSLELFFEMLGFDVEPNAFTLSSVIKACSETANLRLGICFHGVVMVRGFDSNRVISSGLIDMYGRNHQPEDASKVFDEMLEPDAICWTSVVSALTRNDFYDKALEIFYLMHRNHGLSPDGFTFGTILTACGNLSRLRQGKEIHSKVITSGFYGNVVVESSLVDMYGKCKMVSEAQRVFDHMPEKNSVSWSALLGGYCHNGDNRSVIKIFRKMEKIDLYSFGTVLRSCAGLAAIRHGKEIHCQYVRRGGWRDVIVESALVDLYAKCGCINFAYRIFIKMPVTNLITWNSVVCGFAQNGQGKEALRMFDLMVKNGMKPDYITFIGVLFACSHTGLVDEGRKLFALMIEEYQIKPGIEHYNCIVDLLGRAGSFEEAENLIENADCRKDPTVWGVLLGACSSGADSTTAERIAKKMMEIEPTYHLSYVLLTNVYRAVGRYSDALKIRKLMEDRGVKKTSGKSWIEIDKTLGSYFKVNRPQTPITNV